MDVVFDQSDVGRLLARDAEAVEKWFLTYSDTLYTFVYYRVGKDVDIAAEIVQETFVRFSTTSFGLEMISAGFLKLIITNKSCAY